LSGEDGNFYCINDGTIGGTTGSCTCTCALGYQGGYCDQLRDCVATTNASNLSGDDGNFYCIDGTIGGTTGSCTCTCALGYQGKHCDTGVDCVAITNASNWRDEDDENFYCINDGIIGGTTGSCTCTSCALGYAGVHCNTGVDCVATTNASNLSGDDGNFYCINGTIGGTTGWCTCTCALGYQGKHCDTVDTGGCNPYECMGEDVFQEMYDHDKCGNTCGLNKFDLQKMFSNDCMVCFNDNDGTGKSGACWSCVKEELYVCSADEGVQAPQCKNGGKCTTDQFGRPRCSECLDGYSGRFCLDEESNEELDEELNEELIQVTSNWELIVNLYNMGECGTNNVCENNQNINLNTWICTSAATNASQKIVSAQNLNYEHLKYLYNKHHCSQGKVCAEKDLNVSSWECTV